MIHSSQNRITNSVLRMIGESTMGSVDQYTEDIVNRSYKSFKSIDELNEFFKDYMTNFYSNSNLDDIENIRYYTGPGFKEINAILRDNWNYEVNGLLSEDKKKEMIELSRNLSNSMDKTSSQLPSNIKVYRGVSLDSFKDYGVNNIFDLKNLVGQYCYERGFTSTSLVRDSSSFASNSDNWKNYNIEIEYLVPSECSEGLPLITDDLSYSGIKHEFLINSGCLIKIVGALIEQDKAYLTAIVVPKKVWDKAYESGFKK